MEQHLVVLTYHMRIKLVLNYDNDNSDSLDKAHVMNTESKTLTKNSSSFTDKYNTDNDTSQ